MRETRLLEAWTDWRNWNVAIGLSIYNHSPRFWLGLGPFNVALDFSVLAPSHD